MNVYVNQFNTHSGINLLPLAGGLLMAHARHDREIGHQIAFELRIARESPVETVKSYSDPLAVGYCCYMWNRDHSLAVAAEVKRHYPQAVNIFGGPSAPRTAHRIHEFLAAYPQVDAIGMGEGEVTFTEALRRVVHGADFTDVAGLAFRDARTDGIVVNSPRPRLRSLECLPSPFLDGTFDGLMERDGALVTGVIWETNRGCPFGCTFCDWGQATQGPIAEYPIERLREELKWMARNEFEFCWAADANFGIRPRDLVVSEAIAASYRSTGYPRFFQVSWVKNSSRHVIDIYNALAAAGVRAPVALSAQSFDRRTLVAVNRKNIKLSAFQELKEHFGTRGIETYTELILGLPEETYETFASNVVAALSPYRTDFVLVFLCRLLENTALHSPESRARFGIETRMCPIAIPRRVVTNKTVDEFEEIVVATKAMPAADWKHTFEFAYLLSALYNQHLASFVLNYCSQAPGLGIKEFVEYLLVKTTPAHPVLSAMLARLRGHEASVLANGPVVLPLEGFGDWDWDPHEACYLIAARDPGAFMTDLAAIGRQYLYEQDCRDPILHEELFLFQRMLIPTFGAARTSVATFRRPWHMFVDRWNLDCVREASVSPHYVEFVAPLMRDACHEDYLREQVRVTRSGTRTLCQIRPLDIAPREVGGGRVPGAP